MRFVVYCLILILCSSCRTKYIPVEYHHTDSVYVYSTDTLKVTVRDTLVSYPLPAVNIERASLDTLSIISDSLYASMARVSGGLLFHTLYTLPHASINVPVSVKDTLYSSAHYSYANKSDSISAPIIIERKLSKWEQTKINSFYPLVVTIIIVVFSYIRKWLAHKRE